MKKIISFALSLAVCAAMTTMTVNAIGTHSIASNDSQNSRGNSDVLMNTSVIPVPTYSVIIPEKVDFGTLTRTTTDEYQTADCSVTANGVSHLFANDKMLTVTVSSNNGYNISDGAAKPNTIPYTLYSVYTDTTKTEVANNEFLSVSGTVNEDYNLKKTVSGKAVVNKKNVKKAGSFKDVLTFTVGLQEVN